MPQLRIALAQVNPCLGDLAGNADLVLKHSVQAVAEGAHIVVFPEMVLTGYPVEDLALRESFSRASQQQVRRVARQLAELGCAETAVVLGYLDRDGLGPRNAAAVCYQGKIVATQYKHHLPNYGV